MPNKIGIAIFSQSGAVARGVADIVYDLVGDEVRCVHCGLPESRRPEDMVASMQDALKSLRSTEGTAILVDVGATEAAAETAIATLPLADRLAVRICDLPIVEGAITISMEAARGGTFVDVCARAKALLRSQNLLAC